MGSVNLTSMTVNGEQFDIVVGADGEFVCDVHGKRVTANTFAGIKTKIAEQARAFTRIRLPATRIEVHSALGMGKPTLCFTDVVITGKHGGSDRVMYAGITPDGVGPVKMSNWRSKFYDRLSNAQRVRVENLYMQKLAADKAYDDFLKELEIDTDGDGIVKAFNKLQKENAKVAEAVKVSGAKKKKKK